MTNLALHQLTGQYKEAAEKLADMDLPPEAVADTLNALEGELFVKAQNVAMFAQNLDALSLQIKEAEESMARRRKVIENRASSIREYIKSCMSSSGIKSIECPYFKISIKNNPPSVEVMDASLIPTDLMNTPPPPSPVPDKKRIAEKLKAGEDVPGARLIQHTRLDIK